MLNLRVSEWINILAFFSFVLLAWQPGLDRTRRARICFIGSCGLAITLLSALVLTRLVAPLAASITRDWIPCLLVFMFYQQAGQFVTHANLKFEMALERLDRMLVAPWLEWCARRSFADWILNYLEVSYLSYYVVMPLSLAILYLAGRRQQVDSFWTIVQLAAYGSCGMLAFVQTRPPRMIGEKWSVPPVSSKLRAFNLWILRRGSVQTNTFPSAHVAIAAACALALMQVGLAWAGLSLVVVAVSIALGAVAGRYHYAADAVLGFLVAGLALLARSALMGHAGGQ